MSCALDRRSIVALIALLVVTLGPGGAQEPRRAPYTPPPPETIHSVPAEHGMVVAQEKLGAQIGADILRRGGNAVDAAVATGFAMAVTYPQAGNIGGGGFMVIHMRARGEDVAIDYRETAARATTPQIFLGSDGRPDAAKSRDSALGIGVPGTVAGLALALEKYGSGKFTLADLLQPAIELAQAGFVVTDNFADSLPEWHKRIVRAISATPPSPISRRPS
jgi:gamma-glutamyltranspeptidase/glutathione hydrolase